MSGTLLLVITDGRRDCIAQTIPSAEANLTGAITERLIFDDSGDSAHRDWLRGEFPRFEVIDGGPRQGFGGAIRAAWAHIRNYSDAATIFHLEDDFTFNRPVPLDLMAQVLDSHRYLAQLALRRQPWNAAERAAGGIVEQHPDAYTEATDGAGNAWLEHRLFFTTNPCLYRRALIETTHWPDGDQSEGRYGIALREHGFDDQLGHEVHFAFWGSRASGERVTHIGHQRAGTGY